MLFLDVNDKMSGCRQACRLRRLHWSFQCVNLFPDRSGNFAKTVSRHITLIAILLLLS